MKHFYFKKFSVDFILEFIILLNKLHISINRKKGVVKLQSITLSKMWRAFPSIKFLKTFNYRFKSMFYNIRTITLST